MSTYLLGGHYPQGSGLGAQDVFTGRLRFVWPQGGLAAHIELNPAQWQALIMGLPWQRLQSDGAIRVV